jgi:hypothetical protein
MYVNALITDSERPITRLPSRNLESARAGWLVQVVRLEKSPSGFWVDNM